MDKQIKPGVASDAMKQATINSIAKERCGVAPVKKIPTQKKHVEKIDKEVNLEVGINVLEIETRLRETGGEEEISKETEERHQKNFMT